MHALYALLKNRLYLGEIAYRGEIYPGGHAAIIERALWERVQQHLGAKRTARREGERGRTRSLLLGLIYDHTGQRYTPSHTVHHAKRYRYYVAQRPEQVQDARPVRIPAQNLETLVVQRLLRLLSDQLALLDALSAADDDAALFAGAAGLGERALPRVVQACARAGAPVRARGVHVDVSGLGNTNLCVDGGVTLDLSCACVGNGGNCPTDAKKQTFPVDIQAGQSVEPKNGRVNTTFTLPISIGDGLCTEPTCGGGQTTKLIKWDTFPPQGSPATFRVCTTSAPGGQPCSCDGQPLLAWISTPRH